MAPTTEGTLPRMVATPWPSSVMVSRQFSWARLLLAFQRLGRGGPRRSRGRRPRGRACRGSRAPWRRGAPRARRGGLRPRPSSPGSCSTALRMTAAWSSATLPSAIAAWVIGCCSSAAASLSRCLVRPLGWRVVLAQYALVSAAPTSVPSPMRVGGVGRGQLEGGDPLPEPGQRRQRGGEVGCAHGPEPWVEVVELVVEARDSGGDRVGPGIGECRCHTEEFSLRAPTIRVWISGHFGCCGELFQDSFRAAFAGGRAGEERAASRPPTRTRMSWSRRARWRSLLDHRGHGGRAGEERAASRPPRTRRRGLDALAGARCSTTEASPRWSSRRGTSRVETTYPHPHVVVSTRSLALAARPPEGG